MPMSQPLTERAAAKARLQRSQNLHTASCLSAAAEPQAPFAVLLLCPTDPGMTVQSQQVFDIFDILLKYTPA